MIRSASRGEAMSGFLSRRLASIRKRRKSGAGSMFFRHPGFPSTPGPVWCGVIIWMRSAFNVRSSVRSGARVSSSRPHHIPCDTSAREWAGYSHGPGTARPFRCENHDDLYPCAQSWRTVGAESSGSIVRDRDSLMSCNLPLISPLILAVAFAARLFI